MEKWHTMWPDTLLHRLDPAGQADPDQLREALTMSVVVLLTVVLYRIFRRSSGRLLGLMAGRRNLVRTGSFAGFLRGLAQLATVFAAPSAVWGLCDSGEPPLPWQPVLTTGIFMWWLMDVLDHSAIWWSARRYAVVLQSGFGIGRLRREVWPLDKVFASLDGRPLPGKDTVPVQDLPVRLTRRARKQLVPRLPTDSSTETWLQAIATKQGWQPQAPLIVAGPKDQAPAES
jgi:hypothetical protein